VDWPWDARHEAVEGLPRAPGGEEEAQAGYGEGISPAQPPELGAAQEKAREGMTMRPTDRQLGRELTLLNLAEALRRGWHTDPRWREAMERVAREQEEENRESCHTGRVDAGRASDVGADHRRSHPLGGGVAGRKVT
jgi:hypothetical protein